MKKTNIKQCGTHSLKPAVQALVLAGALALPMGAWAQAVPNPFEAEGIITDISEMKADGSVDLKVFGRWYKIPQTAAIHTPTKSITTADLADRTPFPGRAQQGFIGGTAILIGEADAAGNVVIGDAAVEPGETVLLGTVTRNPSTNALAVMGTPVVELPTDESFRMPSEGVHNEFGFPVDVNSIQAGAFGAVEGYFTADDPSHPDGVFYYFLMEATGGQLLNPDTPQSSILRARCDSGGRLEVQGASYLPASNVIDIYNAKTGFNFGSISTVLDPENPQFGSYRFRVDVTDGEVNSDGGCPSEVRAVTRTSSTEQVAAVDGVVAPADTPPPTTNEAPVAVDDVAAVFVGLGTEVHLTLNDTDVNNNLDGTTIQLSNVPAGLAVQDLDNGDVLVTASGPGSYTFNYTVADTDGLISNVATVTIQADSVAMDTVEITRANYRTGKDRFEARGTATSAGAEVTLTVVRTNQAIGTVTADATGAWQIDARNQNLGLVQGDMVRAVSNGGGQHEFTVTISR